MFQLNISSKTQHGTCVLMLAFNLSLQTNKSKKNSKYTQCVGYSDLFCNTTPSPWVIQERETSKLGWERCARRRVRERTRWKKTRCPLPAQNYRPLSRKLPHPLPEWFEKGKQVNKGGEKRRGVGTGMLNKTTCPSRSESFLTFSSPQNHHP